MTEEQTIVQAQVEDTESVETAMCIEKNKVVQLHYRLSDETGELENSQSGHPMAYLHGHRNLIPGLEKALVGKKAGDGFSVEIPPEEAYGLPQPDRQQRVPIKHLFGNAKHKNKAKTKLKVGQVVSVQTDNGPRQVTIVKVGRHVVDVDTNHPLAGKTLSFDLEVVSVRDASAEEIAHGHAHGVGGHHH